MRIDDELYRIAAAKYGLDLKDPIFAAFDKLYAYPKFGLIKGIIDDDFAEFDALMNDLYKENKTCKTLSDILKLFMTLNCRKGFFAKTGNGHGQFDESNYAKWIDMLGHELVNSGTGDPFDGVIERGNGVVNGSKIRAALYYLFDILQYNGSLTNEEPVVTFDSNCFIIGREINIIGIEGIAGGLGTYMTLTEYATLDHPAKTVSGYGFYLVMVNIFTGEEIRKPIIIGEDPLYEGEYAQVGYEMYTPIPVPFGAYRVYIAEDLHSEENISTSITLTYNAIKEQYIPDVNDYIYEFYGSADAFARTLYYKGEDVRIVMPDIFETKPLTDIGINTFADTNVEMVYIPDGVLSIQ